MRKILSRPKRRKPARKSKVSAKESRGAHRTKNTQTAIKHKVTIKAKAKTVKKVKIEEAKHMPKETKAPKIKTSLEEVGARRRGRKEIVSMPSQKEVKDALTVLLTDEFALQYLTKNVSKRALEVLQMLTTPKTDEFIALDLDLKINSVRRILNIMQGYGITNYYVAKNVNGWLSFAWYINTNKIGTFFNYIKSIKGEGAIIKDDCNDYFFCNSCYKSDKMIFTFDSAFEAGFKCGVCGTKFNMINKDEAQRLVYGQEVLQSPEVNTTGIIKHSVTEINNVAEGIIASKRLQKPEGNRK